MSFWTYSFEPTGQGKIACARLFLGEACGAVDFKIDAEPVRACFSESEWAEWQLARELELESRRA